MIPGGIADKLGNRYEAKWVVRSLMDVIADKAQWLKFEGVETEYQGFEFAIARGTTTEWHQTKITAPKGNWTINALNNEGVLNAFSNRLSADENAHCFFVSQDNAKDFRILADKAQKTNSPNQFVSILSKDQNISYEQLKKVWEQSPKIIFNWLNRSHVIVFPERELDSWIESHGDLYFYEGGVSAFPNLRTILEKNFNKTLTVESIRNAIKSQGALSFKEWALDPTIQQKLDQETSAYLQTYTPFGAGGEAINRDQSNTLINEISKPDGAELVLLTGVAGSGKSGIIRNVIKHLRASNTPHLAFRVDHFLSCSTREELGERLTGRKESPVSTLKGMFPSTSPVLFIDQVDAISEVSGRNGQIKEVIFRLIKDADIFCGIKIVIACRTFDLNSDSRLKILKKADKSKQIDIPLLGWTTDVKPLLKNKGVDTALVNKPQQQLLCLPINLAVFLEINDPKFLFHSISNLHEKLIEKKQRIISKERNVSWSLLKPLTAMCDWMNKRQKLSAPSMVMDDYPNAVDILASEGLIVSFRGKVNFFHESFFDYIYARSFLNDNQSIIDLLTTDEQHLFRRTQVRQILEALRQNDIDRYLVELSSVLSHKNIRFHIKTAVCQWLSSIEKPGKKEFEIIAQFIEPDKNFHQFFHNAVLSTPAWFDLLNKKKWVQKQLESKNKEQAETVLAWLRVVARIQPSEVAKLLRSWWKGNEKHAIQLLSWFGLVRDIDVDEDLFQLCEDLINSNPKNLFQKPDHTRITMLLHTWENKPGYCGKILHSLFQAWFVLNPKCIPFGENKLKMMSTHSLANVAKKAPLTFLQGTTDALARSIDMVIAEGTAGRSWHSFRYRTYSGNHFGFDEFLTMYRSALKKVAQGTPTKASVYLKKLNPQKHQCLMHLHLEVIQANPIVFAKQLPALASNKIIFESGWKGANWMSFAKACHKAMPQLNTQEKKIIELAILNYTPERDYVSLLLKEMKHKKDDVSYTKNSTLRYLNRSGYIQWCILETIGGKLLSPLAATRLDILRRKFPKEKIAEPDNIRAGFVKSPIEIEQCEKMKDGHWLSAIQRYGNNEDRRYDHNNIFGGARQLATMLQKASKNAPTRFSDFSLKIPDKAHHSYIEHILRGLTEAETPSDESLTQAVKRAHQHIDKPFGSLIAQLLQSHPHIAANPTILDILIWYALNGEANESEDSDIQNTDRETIDINNLIERGRSLYVRGINGARGNAWEALGSVLWQIPEKTERRICNTIETAIEKESLISVRCCIMKALEPLFNRNKDWFSDSLQKLITPPENTSRKNNASWLSPLITHTGIHLFPYIFHFLPELADELTMNLLESKNNTKKLIGAWLIFCESFRNDIYIYKADKLVSISVDYRRLLAAVTGDAIKWAEDRQRAETLLNNFFFDEDEQVRNKAAETFSNIKEDEVESYLELTANFIKSPTFLDNSFSVIHMLENATCDVLEIVIEAAQRIIQESIKNKNLPGNGTDIYQLQDLLKREYISSESDTNARKKLLDLIDLMLSHEIFGVDSIVSTHDRWY